jgi:hypothetical protein
VVGCVTYVNDFNENFVNMKRNKSNFYKELKKKILYGNYTHHFILIINFLDLVFQVIRDVRSVSIIFVLNISLIGSLQSLLS